MDKATREFVRKRAKGCCEYCQISSEFFPQSFQVEHIVPKKHHGNDDEANLALACERCNLHKGVNLAGLDPVTRELTRLFNPREDVWDEHFYEQPSGKIDGRTAIGRTTVDVLAMNASNRVSLRAAIWSIRNESNQ